MPLYLGFFLNTCNYIFAYFRLSLLSRCFLFLPPSVWFFFNSCQILLASFFLKLFPTSLGVFFNYYHLIFRFFSSLFFFFNSWHLFFDLYNSCRLHVALFQFFTTFFCNICHFILISFSILPIISLLSFNYHHLHVASFSILATFS